MMASALGSAAIVAVGAAAAGFAQGMTGFAFASIALSIWAWALPPQTAAPLAVFGALLGQLASFVSFRGGFEWSKIAPFVAGGLVGAPIGVFLLHSANTQGFRLAVGILLMAYCLVGFFFRDLGHVTRGGRGLDALFGGLGGVLGGLGGMAGFAPAMWTQLRGWKRDVRRATMQAYNIAMHCLTIGLYARSGTLAHADLSQFLIVAPAMLIPSWLGARVYTRFSEQAFTRVVLIALGGSGAALAFNAARGLLG
jgi:uncharacterized membrane protein YfcA